MLSIVLNYVLHTMELVQEATEISADPSYTFTCMHLLQLVMTWDAKAKNSSVSGGSICSGGIVNNFCL